MSTDKQSGKNLLLCACVERTVQDLVIMTLTLCTRLMQLMCSTHPSATPAASSCFRKAPHVDGSVPDDSAVPCASPSCLDGECCPWPPQSQPFHIAQVLSLTGSCTHCIAQAH